MKFNFFKKIWGKKEDKVEESRKDQEIEKNEDKTLEIKIETGETLSLKPLMSEKSIKLSKDGKYVFLVNHGDKKLNKKIIKNSIEKMFKVNVVEIRTANFKKRERGRSKLKNVRPKFKKVFITLKKDQLIPIFE